MKRKKVLIVYATYGSGHKTVANYIYEYFQKYSNYEIKIIDLMDYENLIGYISKKAFEQNFKHITSSMVFSMIYEIFDFNTTTIPYKYITKAILKNKKLQEEITEYNPDLLISTHFFGNIVLGMLNKKKKTNTKIISIITDHKLHKMWTKDQKSIDAYIVSNEIIKKELIKENVNSKKIYPYGIPLSEKFYNVEDKELIKKKYQVNNGKKTFLFFAGGSDGSNFSFKYLKRLLEEEYDINIIYVCGKNTKLKRKTEKYIEKNNYENINVIGFSKEVNNLLNIADVVISKPGGISITESLEMKKPMLLIPGNGGPENHNARYVCKNGYGIKCKTPRKLAKTVSQILKKKHILENMKIKLNNHNNNKSIEKIYKLSKKLLND